MNRDRPRAVRVSTRPERASERSGDPARQPGYGSPRDTERASSLVAITTLVERVGEYEGGNADEERTSHQFENAHKHLLAASQYGDEQRPFKPLPWNISWNKVTA